MNTIADRLNSYMESLCPPWSKDPTEPVNLVVFRTDRYCLAGLAHVEFKGAHIAGISAILNWFPQEAVVNVRWVNLYDRDTNPDCLVGRFEVTLDRNTLDGKPAPIPGDSNDGEGCKKVRK